MGQTAKERQSRQVVRLQVKEKQSTERKEGKARVGKKDVGWERRETGACRSGVGRGNQEGGGGPRCSAHKDVHPARFTIWLSLSVCFSAPFSGHSRRSRPSDKSRRVAKVHTHLHTHTLACAREATCSICDYARLRLSSASQKPNYTKHLPDGAGRQAARKKIVHSVWRPRPLGWPSRWANRIMHSGSASSADACLLGGGGGVDTLVPLENAAQPSKRLVKPRPARVGGWETQKSNPHVTYHPPAAVAHHPHPSCKVCSFFVCWPLSPLSLSERQSKPRCLSRFDFAIRPPGTQTRGPRWNTKWFNQTKKKKK